MAEVRPRLTLNRTYAAASDSTFTGLACFGRIKDVDLVLIPTYVLLLNSVRRLNNQLPSANDIYMLEMLTGVSTSTVATVTTESPVLEPRLCPQDEPGP